MTIIDIEKNADVEKLHEHADRLKTHPTLIVIVAHWCPHCVAMKDTIDSLKGSIAPAGANIIVIELAPYQSIKSSAHPLIDSLQKHGAATNGVPYVGMAMPRMRGEHAVKEHVGRRSPVSIARAFLNSVREHKSSRRHHR